MSWLKQQNKRTEGRYLEDLLETCLDPELLEWCLAYFVVEGTCKTKGEPKKCTGHAQRCGFCLQLQTDFTSAESSCKLTPGTHTSHAKLSRWTHNRDGTAGASGVLV